MPDTMNNFELKLPSDVLESIPPGREDMIRFLAKYFDSVIDEYDVDFQRRTRDSALAGPLSKYERSMLKDFLIRAVIGKQDEEPPMLVAVG